MRRKDDDKAGGDEQHFDDAARAATQCQYTHRAGQGETETEPLDAFSEMEGGDGTE